MPDRRREPTARKLVLEIGSAADPEAALVRVTSRLDCRLESAELERQHSEALLAELAEKLERIARARRAAKRARGGAYRLRREQHEEQLRAARNARRRQRYRERSESHPSGTGRTVRIEVDATAWRALRAEAARRRTSAKQLLGEIVRGLAIGFDPGAISRSSDPRWRRTGDGRRARHSTLVDADDETWARLGARAISEGVTLALLLGRAVEDEVRQHRWSTTWPERESKSIRAWLEQPS